MAKLIAYACLVVSGTLAAVYGCSTGNSELYGLLRAVGWGMVAVVGGCSPARGCSTISTLGATTRSRNRARRRRVLLCHDLWQPGRHHRQRRQGRRRTHPGCRHCQG
jgi:hypothetical protein